jgi:hypothetical protein
VECQKAGGRAGDAATASGGEVQLEQKANDVARAGGGQREGGKWRGRGRVARGEVLSSTETAGAAHMAGRTVAARGRGEQRRGKER